MARTMTTSSPLEFTAPRHVPMLQASIDGLLRVVETLFIWQERARQRRFLAVCNGEVLRDIGIGRAELEAEASKPFWRS